MPCSISGIIKLNPEIHADATRDTSTASKYFFSASASLLSIVDYADLLNFRAEDIRVLTEATAFELKQKILQYAPI